MAGIHTERLAKEFKPGRQVRLDSPLCDTSSETAVLHWQLRANTDERFIDLVYEELVSCVCLCGGHAEATGSGSMTALFHSCDIEGLHYLRALGCALRMMRTLAAFNAAAGPLEKPLEAAAAVGRSGDSDYRQVTGEALPGTVIASGRARMSCRGSFTWKQVSRDTWQATGRAGTGNVHPVMDRHALLGRTLETEQLRSAWSICSKAGIHPPVLVTGKAGIGKTMFVESFINEAEESGAVIVRLQNRLLDQPPLGMWLPLMSGGPFDPYRTIMSNVRRMLACGRLVILIEDLHWADASSVRLLNHLSRALFESGAFIITTSRNEPEGDIGGIGEKLVLQELDEDAAVLLVASMLGVDRISLLEQSGPLLDGMTGGNPLLIVELVLHLLETGGFQAGPGGLVLADEPLEGIIPLNAESMIQARQNNLLPEELEAVRAAAVMGDGFSVKHFSCLMGRLGFQGGEILLSRLVNMGYFSVSLEGSHSFRNSIASGTVYRSIPLDRKKEMHSIAAEVLSSSGETMHKDTQAIALARHWIESDTGEKAIPWLFEALEQCIVSGDMIRAETLARELRARIGEDSESPGFARLSLMESRLHIAMGKFQLALDTASRILHSFKGRELAILEQITAQAKENLGMPLPEAAESYEKAAETAIKAGDWNIAASSLAALGSLELAQGKRKEALEAFNRALEYRDSLDSTAGASLHGNMGILMHRTGSHEEAARHYRITLEMGRRAGNMGIEANALAFIGQVEINMGNREEGLCKYQEALSIHRRAGNQRGECTTLGNLGGQLARFGDTCGAIEMLEKAIEIASEIGHSRGIMSFHSNLGLAYKISGNYPKAEEHIRIAMGMVSVSGDKRAMAVTHLNLATVLAKMSRLTEATDESRRALRFACAVDSLTTQARALGNIGWLMLNTDRAPMAARFFREAYRRSSLAEDLSMLADSKVGEGRALFDSGDYQEAAICLDRALELKGLYGMDHEALEGLEELSKLLGVTE